MRFIIRDDDTCGFTSPEEIIECYESIWNDVPVSLSVTPFRVPGNDRNAPERYIGNMDVMPLSKNTELVEFLRYSIRQRKLDITLHGYNHWRYKGLPEYIGADDLYEKARHGKEYLDDLLEVDIQTFVPPNNGIERPGLDAITRAGMNLGGMLPLWSSKYRRINARSLSLCPGVWWHQRIRRKRYPYILDLGDHKEVSCHTVGPRSSYTKLKNELAYCHSMGGVFVLATHYHAFGRKTDDGYEVKKVVMELVDSAAGYSDTEFLGFNSIW